MSDVQLKSGFTETIEPERREFGRRVMFRHATAVVAGGAVWSCIIIDKSEIGARIRVKDKYDFPDNFKLIIEDDDFVAQCIVIHRASDVIGIQFIRPPSKLSQQRDV
jgi:PilZ domain